MTNEPLDQPEKAATPVFKMSYFVLGIFFWINLISFGYLLEQIAYNLVLMAGLNMDGAIWTKELVSLLAIIMLTIYGFNKFKNKDLSDDAMMSKLLRNLMISFVIIQIAQFLAGYYLSMLTVSMASDIGTVYDQKYRYFNNLFVIVNDYVKYILVAIILVKKRKTL